MVVLLRIKNNLGAFIAGIYAELFRKLFMRFLGKAVNKYRGGLQTGAVSSLMVHL